jgi:hypothetical protein
MSVVHREHRHHFEGSMARTSYLGGSPERHHAGTPLTGSQTVKGVPTATNSAVRG